MGISVNNIVVRVWLGEVHG